MARRKAMSDGEKLVWAMTWVAEFRDQMERKPKISASDTYEEMREVNRLHEAGCAASAAEHARAAVLYMRDSVKDVREGCGGEVEAMLKEMLG